MKFQIVAVADEPTQDPTPTTLAEETPPGADPPIMDNPQEDFHAMLVIEGVWTGDSRYIEEGALTWRPLPLPFMATARTTEGHDTALLVANITRVERIGREIHAYGPFVKSEDPEVINLQTLVNRGELRGVSVDLSDMEYEILIPTEDNSETDGDGNIILPSSDMDIKMRVLSAVIMGATVTPFPAFQEAYIESLAALTAALSECCDVSGWITPTNPVIQPGSIIASGHPIDAPVVPPSAWFTDPKLSGPTPLTVSDEGRVYGHLAVWGQCHIGFADRCIEPPHSAASYAHFLTGEILCDDGTRLPVGQITFGAGHASHQASVTQVAAHYDNTASAAADVTAGEDDYGIWVSGALRPGLAPADIRALMAADVSGDWRRIGGVLELVAVLAVNVPGFPKIRVREAEGLVASLSLPAYNGDEVTAPSKTLQSTIERIAASIGRSKAARLAEVRARVKKEAKLGLRV